MSELDGATIDALLDGPEAGEGKPLAPGSPVAPRAPAPLPKAKDLLPGSADAEQAQADGTLPVGKAQASAARLAQVVNLHIAGYSLEQIGATIGASAEEIDRLLSQDTARYVRSQPALRTYVRNWVSNRYTTMLEAVWDDATHPGARMLDSQDRALRILDRMTKLHGAEAPTQTEIKVDAAPEAVESLVKALSAAQGLGYDASIFDTVDAEVVSESVTESAQVLVVSGNAVEDDQPDDGQGLES